jgi:hypothetical protein
MLKSIHFTKSEMPSSIPLIFAISAVAITGIISVLATQLYRVDCLCRQMLCFQATRT